MTDIIEDLRDILKQPERYTFYVASVAKRAITEIERLRALPPAQMDYLDKIVSRQENLIQKIAALKAVP